MGGSWCQGRRCQPSRSKPLRPLKQKWLIWTSFPACRKHASLTQLPLFDNTEKQREERDNEKVFLFSTVPSLTMFFNTTSSNQPTQLCTLKKAYLFKQYVNCVNLQDGININTASLSRNQAAPGHQTTSPLAGRFCSAAHCFQYNICNNPTIFHFRRNQTGSQIFLNLPLHQLLLK